MGGGEHQRRVAILETTQGIVPFSVQLWVIYRSLLRPPFHHLESRGDTIQILVAASTQWLHSRKVLEQNMVHTKPSINKYENINHHLFIDLLIVPNFIPIFPVLSTRPSLEAAPVGD